MYLYKSTVVRIDIIVEINDELNFREINTKKI